MKLAELKTAGFVDLLASDAPAPGGGSAAALEGALGAALTAMVCGLTVGKKKYAEFQELAEEAQKKATDLKARFVDVMDRDTEAFNAWRNVLINIGSLKNKELAADYQAKGEALLAKALPLADQIYDTVVKSM